MVEVEVMPSALQGIKSIVDYVHTKSAQNAEKLYKEFKEKDILVATICRARRGGKGSNKRTTAGGKALSLPDYLLLRRQQGSSVDSLSQRTVVGEQSTPR